MKTFTLSQIYSQYLFDNTSSSSSSTSNLLCVIDELNSCLLIINSDFKVYVFNYHNRNKCKLIHEIELECVLDSDILMKLMESVDTANVNPFVYIAVTPDLEGVIIALKSGEIINIPTDNTNNKVTITKIIHDNNVTITAFEPSPNQEYIAVVLSNYTLMLISYDAPFNVINTCTLDDCDLSSINEGDVCNEASITFKQDGELFAVVYNVNGNALRKCLVRDSKLSIRKGPARADNKIVFSVSEAPLDYLSNVVAFQPNGSLIAYYDHIHRNIFFSEKNCLIHGTFPIVLNNISSSIIKPILLKWNFDSPMLLFIFECESQYYIQIYHRSNYEWTLQHEIIKQQRITTAKFSELISNQLIIVYSNNIYETINFIWTYSSSLSYNNNLNSNNGEICVMNNHSIKYTPLGIVNIPPPMCLVNITDNKGVRYCWFKQFVFALYKDGIDVYKSNARSFEKTTSLAIDSSVNGDINCIKKVIFVPHYNKNIGVFVLNQIIPNDLTQEKLVFIIFKVVYTLNEQHGVTDIQFENDNVPLYTSTEIIKGNSVILFNSIKHDRGYENEYYNDDIINNTSKQNDITTTQHDTKPKQMTLDMLELDHMGTKRKHNYNEDNDNVNNNNINENSVTFYYSYYNTSTNETHINKMHYNTTTYELNIDDNNNVITMQCSNNERINQIETVMIYKEEEIVICLTHNNKLYYNGNVIANDINSFIHFKHFLLFTQTSSGTYSTLHLINLNDNTIHKTLTSNSFTQNLQYKNFNMRTIERNSSLVTCSSTNVILQMPRGNLETITPRLIALYEIKKQVHLENYNSAFSLCRKHKINLNFIYDINPSSFISNINTFISKVSKPEYINLFINSLDNSICEEYQILFNKHNDNDNKVNHICELIRNRLLLIDNNEQYINSILITYTKQTPPLYLDALKLVQRLKIENNAKADKALEFLCWIVNANTLFDFALKTYDFELVIMCAKHTQKDPKEYLLYLNKLNEIKQNDVVLMKYQINIDLKYYEDALTELSKGGEKYFDKVVELINEHHLYDIALELYNQPLYEKQYEKIYDCKGNYYYNNVKDTKQAACCYIRSKNYQQALKCYVELGNVNETLTLLLLLNSNDLYETLIRLLDVCKSKKLPHEVSNLYTYIITSNTWKQFTPEQLLNISVKLIECLISGKCYTKAYFTCINLMKIFSSDNTYITISTSIKSKLNDEIQLCYDLYYNTLSKNYTFFIEKYTRLTKVQELKREHPELFVIGVDKGENEQDNVSDTGSVRSRSNKSSKTSMSKKTKMKKPRRNVKEGSPMEEENLIAVIKELVVDDKEIELLYELSEVLRLCKFNGKAKELSEEIKKYVKDVNAKIKGLFSVEQVNFAKEFPIVNELFPQLGLGNVVGSTVENVGGNDKGERVRKGKNENK